MFTELVARAYKKGYGTSAPTSGQWSVNDVIENTAPAATGSPRGWVCTVAGTPGTWVAYGQLKDKSSVTSVTAAGNVALTDNIVEIGTGGFNVTLAAPSASVPGNVVRIVNANASPVTLVAGTGTSIVGNVTLSANASATLESAGTVWYRG